MLDLKFIRDNPDQVRAGLARKSDKTNIDLILQFDGRRREIIARVEQLKAERNQASGEIAKRKKAGDPATEAVEAMRKLGDDIAALDKQLAEVETELNKALAWIPNIPHESVPVGDETHNTKVIRNWGEIPKPRFQGPSRIGKLGQKLGILDLEAAAKISGSGSMCSRAGGTAGTGADQLHARPAHGAGFHRSAGSIHRQCRHHVRHRATCRSSPRTCTRPKGTTCI